LLAMSSLIAGLNDEVAFIGGKVEIFFGGGE
jgi:hypothetical protein